MDLDEWGDLDAACQVPSRRPKFAPKAAKFKPKIESQASKLEVQESEPASKPPEPEYLLISNAEKDGKEEEIKINAIPKLEPSAEMEIESNARDAMDVDKEEPKQEQQEEVEEEEEEEEDIVVREIDVFFTPSIDASTQLYVMQYPLRPCWRPYELDERCEEVRVKPGSSEVEVDLSIDDSANWDADIANRLKMTKQTLSSSWTPPLASGYAVGTLMGNKLHLNPIHAVVQLRPSLEYLKSSDRKEYLTSSNAKMKNNATGDAEVTVKLEDSNKGKPAGGLWKQNKRMESGNEHKADAPEYWIPLKYHDSKSDLSSRYLQKMMAEEDSSMEFTMSPYDYMRSLCPGANNNHAKPKGLSKRVLLSLPLEERIGKLLLKGPPVQRFGVLKHFAPDDSDEDVLKVLQKHAQLVQGLWAAKSILVLPDSSPSEGTKLDGPKRAARDYVLLLFSKSLVINSSQLNVPVKFKEDVKHFLNMYAVERPSFKDWKFKEQKDESFVKLYPDIAKQQAESWKRVEDTLADFFNRDKRGVLQMKKAMGKPIVGHNPARSLNSDSSVPKTATGALSKMTMTNETREALRKTLPKIFQNHKVCSFQLICQSLRDLSQSTIPPKADPRVALAAASGADAPPHELQEVISEVATKIHGFYVLKSSPDHPEYDPLRKVVIELLLVRGPNAKLKKAEVIEAARHALKRDVTNSEYIKVMTDFCQSKGSAWLLKSVDGKPS